VNVLLVKMSSLGDVVHALAGVTDAASRGARFDWVVEEGFASIPALHGAVDEVLPIAWRRWRGGLWQSRAELTAFLDRLRANRYDLVLDSQGLVKSAVVTRLARGARRFGFDARSAREPVAAACYSASARIETGRHAVDRQRELFAAALGYEVRGPASFGISSATRSAGTKATAVLLHGTTWPSKEWPEPMWIALADRLAALGLQPVLPAGNERERERATRIASSSAAQVVPPRSVGELVELLRDAAVVVGVDSGLTHLAGALGTATVAIYGSTSSALTGSRGERVANIAADFRCAPCFGRECTYRGARQRYANDVVEPACYASVTPERVIVAALELMDAGRVQHL
jgi:heptosyltransferase-1